MSTMDHVRILAETIGPRGSTTTQEAEAAGYAARVLEEVGFEPISETFTSGRSSFTPYLIFASLILVGEVFFLVGARWGAISALLILVFALLSAFLELSFRSNPLRWLLPKGRSQNVWTRILPQGESREQVVVVGHLDSNRTPLFSSSDGWVRFLGFFVPLYSISIGTLAVLFLLGSVVPRPLWQILSIPATLVILFLFILMLQAALSPFSPGANDNATAVAAVLSLAGRLKQEPLAHTTVWALLSGCEEVGCYGADAFVQAHRDELGCPIWISLEILGGVGAEPNYLVSEKFVRTIHSDPDLLAIAAQTAPRHPELGVKARRWKSAYTEGQIGAKYGFRVLTIVSFRPDGLLPEWHRPTDVVDNVDPEVLNRCERFLWEVLREIDGRRN